jgi:kumamolisin
MKRCSFCILAVLAIAAPARGAPTSAKASSISARVREATVLEREDPMTQHPVVVGLDLRNREELESLLADIQNPASPRYRRFLTSEEFSSLYAPSTDTEQRVVDHLRANGLSVTRRFSNRLLVGAVGSVAALNRAFGVELHRVLLKGAPHFAAINEPSLPDEIAAHVVGVIGLDDLSAKHPHVRRIGPAVMPKDAVGGFCCSFSSNDLKVFYDNGGSYDGAGQTVVIAGVFAWSGSDINTFNNWWGLASLPAASRQVCTGNDPTASGCRVDFSSADQSSEITFDVEYAHGTAPGATILNYMAASASSADFITMYNQIVTDNPGHIVTTSWGSCEAGTAPAEQHIDDDIFANANAIGQTWFAASGDSGSRDCGTSAVTVDHPANSPHVMGVGGTSAECSGGMTNGNTACAGWGSESGWSDSGGGVSLVFTRPQFQTGCGVPAGTQRLVPDVALEADPSSPGNFVYENGKWRSFGGTSGGAPQWAGIFAELNQELGGTGLGNPGAHLYSVCGTNAFHDIITGSNGDYSAMSGYDMVTGLGTPDVATLLVNFPTVTPRGTPSPTPTAPPGLIPGRGAVANNCTLEWSTTPVPPVGLNGLPGNRLDCTDGDSACDFGPVGDNACTFHLAVCFNVADDRLPGCTPTDVRLVQILSPSATKANDTVDLANLNAIENAVTNLGAAVGGLCRNRVRQGQFCLSNADCDSAPGSGNGICHGHYLVFSSPLASHNVCTSVASVTVPLRIAPNGLRKGSKRLGLKAKRGEGGTDTDWLSLVCHPLS